MIHSRVSGGAWYLTREGVTLASHRPDAPFVTAVKQEKRYSTSRGSVKTEIVELERVPLTAVKEEGEKRLRFSGGEHSFTLRLAEEKGGVKLRFEGEAGWASSFSASRRKT